jgi:hypothetical protein
MPIQIDCQPCRLYWVWSVRREKVIRNLQSLDFNWKEQLTRVWNGKLAITENIDSITLSLTKETGTEGTLQKNLFGSWGTRLLQFGESSIILPLWFNPPPSECTHYSRCFQPFGRENLIAIVRMMGRGSGRPEMKRNFFRDDEERAPLEEKNRTENLKWERNRSSLIVVMLLCPSLSQTLALAKQFDESTERCPIRLC